MKKTLIAVGLVAVLTALSVWLYLIIFGIPKDANEIFSNFTTNNTEQASYEPETSTNQQNEGLPRALRQVTTRQVVGASVHENTMQFIERGTGHIYATPISGGNESMISGTTIPRTVDARFSSDGTHVAIITETDTAIETVVGSVQRTENGSGNMEGKTLPINAHEVAFGEQEDVVYYLTETESGATGFSYNITSGTNSVLFTLPLRNIEILWGKTIYAYTTPTNYQPGHIYKVEGDSLSYVTNSKTALMAIPYSGGLVLTYTENEHLTSIGYESDGYYEIPIGLIPEKCVAHPVLEKTLFCAAPYEYPSNTAIPDDWYKGRMSFSDTLWMINISSSNGTLLSDLLTTTGREIDVSQIGTDPEGKYIWFINKNDDSLWLYDTTAVRN